MNDLGLDTAVLLTPEEVKLLEQLRELEAEMQKGLQRLSDPCLTTAERAEFKEKLLSIANFKIELTRQLEELAQEEIRDQNNKIRKMGWFLEDRDIALGFRDNPPKSSRKKKAISLPVTFDTESNVFCICRKNIGGEMVECANDYCKVMWFHKSCVALKGPETKVWFCEECLQKKDCKPRRKQ